MNIILNTLENFRKRGDVCTDTLICFLIKGAKFAKIYLLRKIQKRLHNLTGRTVVLNCEYYTQNISSFLDFHLNSQLLKNSNHIKKTLVIS